MCELVFLHRSIEQLAAELSVTLHEPGEPSSVPGVSDGSQLPVLRYLWKSDERRLEPMRWGLVAHFMETPKNELKFRLVRAEHVNKRSAFRVAFRRQRCLIPVDSFCASRSEDDVAVRYTFSKRDGSMLYLAGVWDTWTHPESGEPLHSCAVITTRANHAVAPIQNRMPAILEPDLHARWLDEVRTPTPELWQMLRPSEEQAWSMLRVGAPTPAALVESDALTTTRTQVSSACRCA